MIIISQDKNGILNFDNIQLCRINQEGIVYVFLNEYDSFKLGEYSTEERAKEVLQEITEFWRNGAMTDCKGFICYEMPER